MIAALLLLVMIVDCALTGWLFATVKGLKLSVTRTAKLVKRICAEDSSPDEGVEDE